MAILWHTTVRKLLTVVGPPVVVMPLVWLLCQLPSEIISCFTAWLLASFPIGILIGNCAHHDEG